MKTVVIFGGSGFVGRHIIRRIAKNGHKIIIPHQTQTNEAKLRLLGTTGQVIPLNFNHLYEDRLSNLIDHSDVVINLKTLWDQKRISFEKGIFDFNVNLVNLIKKTKKNTQFMYFSGIGIDEKNDSERSKAIFQSEKYIQKNLINSIIIKPGVIIGGGDQFLKGLTSLFKMSFFVPLFGNGLSKFQPVFIDDVSMAINNIIESDLLKHYIYEIVGSDIFTYKEFYNYLAMCMNKTRVFVPVPFQLAKIAVSSMEKISFSYLSSEQLKLFERDNISSNNHKKLEDLKIFPQDIREITKKIIEKNI
jgi:NADH dehydrogenase